ncbi:MAG: hypothetical protein UMV23_03275, partial [Halanaerobium sp.]|nr:hypothetical protein [Halanaerobium sp.]
MQFKLSPKKIIYPVSILIILALGFWAFLNVENLWQRLEDELVLAIEQGSAGNISIGEIDFFPFNKLILRNVKADLTPGGGGQVDELSVNSVVLTVSFQDILSRKPWVDKIEIEEVRLRGYQLQLEEKLLAKLSERRSGKAFPLPSSIAGWQGEIELEDGTVYLPLPAEALLPNPLPVENLDGKVQLGEDGLVLALQGEESLFEKSGVELSARLDDEGYQALISISAVASREINQVYQSAIKIGWLSPVWKNLFFAASGTADLFLEASSEREAPYKASVHFHQFKGNLNNPAFFSILADQLPEIGDDWQDSLNRLRSVLPERPQFALDGTIDWTSLNLKFNEVGGRLGNTEFILAGSYFLADGYSDLKLDLNRFPAREFLLAALAEAEERFAGNLSKINLDALKDNQELAEGRSTLHLTGSLSSPHLKGELIIPGNDGGTTLLESNFSIERGSVHIQGLSLDIPAGDISVQGSIGLGEQKSFYLDSKLTGVGLAELKRHWKQLQQVFVLPDLNPLPTLDGQADISALITGEGWQGEDLNVIGNVQVKDPVFQDYTGDLLEVSFGISQEQIALSSGFLTGSSGSVSFKGQIDFAGNYSIDIDKLRGNTRQLFQQLRLFAKLEIPAEYAGVLDQLPPSFEFTGNISGQGLRPRLTGELFLEDFGWARLSADLERIEIVEAR